MNEFEKIEQLLKNTEKNYEWALKTNPHRAGIYKKRITSYKVQLEELARNQPLEANRHLKLKNDTILDTIIELEANQDDDESFKKEIEDFNKFAYPERFLKIEPEPVIEPVSEPEPVIIQEPVIEIDLKSEIEQLKMHITKQSTIDMDKIKILVDKLTNPEKYKPTEPEPEPEPELIPCPNCGKMVKGEKGLKTHESRWCPTNKLDKAEVEVSE